jgi:hypothetical protein
MSEEGDYADPEPTCWWTPARRAWAGCIGAAVWALLLVFILVLLAAAWPWAVQQAPR